MTSKAEKFIKAWEEVEDTRPVLRMVSDDDRVTFAVARVDDAGDLRVSNPTSRNTDGVWVPAMRVEVFIQWLQQTFTEVEE